MSAIDAPLFDGGERDWEMGDGFSRHIEPMRAGPVGLA
jgi:hypothetical protein